jgi:serine/threonine-protein kinase
MRPSDVPTDDPVSHANVVAVLNRIAPPGYPTGGSVESGLALLERLVLDRVLNRIAARAAYLAAAGAFEARDLKQLVPPQPVRARPTPGPTAAAPAPAAAGLPPGATIGRWTVAEVIHRGPQATIYGAVHPELGVPVAVKLPATAAAAAQLTVEAEVLARVAHPNVVRLWDAGRHGASPFVVLERLGGSLSALLARGRVNPARALRFGRRAARGLRAAFRAGYTHGDVKPGNLLRAADDTLRVADFGLARPVGASPPAGEWVSGSWPYLAPERFEGAGDHRADIYALGLTLYHLLSGRPPVEGGTPAACLARHRALALEPLHWWLPDVSRGASALILRMAARNPDDRPGDYDELLSELAGAARRAPPTPPRTRT